ncbi:MAG: hypothetical protein JNL33_02260 [Betaproteobacteria bacterium]|nr:hypothetical protein [Betaproteobacteria bacterium]
MTAAARDRDEASPLALDLIGANRRMRDTLEMVMRGPARGRYVLADGAQALAVIVNLDGVGAQAEWSRYRALHPERPTIALALDSQPVPGADAIVSKPVQVDRLVEALDRVRAIIGRPAPVPATSSVSSRPPTPAPQERNRSGSAPAGPDLATAAPPVPVAAQPVIPGYRATEFMEERRSLTESDPLDRDPSDAVCGSAADVDADDPVQLRRRFCTSGTAVLECLRVALSLSRTRMRPAEIHLHGNAVMIVEWANASVTTPLSDEQLRALCGTSFAPGMLKAVPSTASGVSPVSGRTTSMEALLWKTALWTYRGRLPAGTPMNERFRLESWPNLTRLLPTPNATRVAALLVRHPMRLPQVAKALSIPQRHVFAFYGAASTIGLIDVPGRVPEADEDGGPPEPHSRRSLLGRIASRLPRDDSGHDAGEGA